MFRDFLASFKMFLVTRPWSFRNWQKRAKDARRLEKLLLVEMSLR